MRSNTEARFEKTMGDMEDRRARIQSRIDERQEARDERGEVMGFCSALLLPIDGGDQVLHLGLTCVHPDARGKNLTHHLTSKLLLNFIIKKSFHRFFQLPNNGFCQLRVIHRRLFNLEYLILIRW